MKYLFKENINYKKVNKVLDKYKELLRINKNKSKSIMLIVPNSQSKIYYERSLNLDFSEELNITTYMAFVKKELVKYWPLVLEDCNDIKSKLVAPIFISNSLSEYIITDQVRKRRNLDGYFEDLTGTNKNIAKNINININKAALGLIDFKTIGEKIYLSKKNRDKLVRFSYSQMNEIIDYYVDILLSNSMLDNSISIYLYNNYLLQNEMYIKNISREIKYLIVDSLETSSSAEVEFIDKIWNFVDDSYIYLNESRDYSAFNNIDIDYINKKIISKFTIEDFRIEVDSKKILIEDLYLLPAKIKLNQSSQLYSEMIEEVCNKVIELVVSGEEAKNIAIISPINNTVLDYQVHNILNNNNIEVFNSKKDSKIIEHPYANALVVASCLFYGYSELIKDEDYISFIEILLEKNRIQAYKIYRNKSDNEEYKNLIEYIEEKRTKEIKIYEFLIQFYIDKMLILNEGKLNVSKCKQIIYESEVFTENISLLGLDKNKDKEKIFIEALKSNIKDFYSAYDLEELKEDNKVIITTPYAYISSGLDRPTQIWVDIGSNAWNMKIEKDISNVVVLRRSFEVNKIYNDAMEENYKKYYLYNMIYNILLSAKNVYAYKSEYTVNGYIQESILYSLLLKLINKEGNADE